MKPRHLFRRSSYQLFLQAWKFLCNIASSAKDEITFSKVRTHPREHLQTLLCQNTVLVHIFRGMMDLHTTVPVVVTEQLEIPKLCLSGKAPPRGTTIELSHIEVSTCWFEFIVFKQLQDTKGDAPSVQGFCKKCSLH